MSLITPNRRRFLSALGTGAATLPLITLPGFVQAAGPAKPSGNILILIELAGGNDGLNTVVPITDPRYRNLRPEIGIARNDALTLETDTSLHSAMRGVADLWEDGDVQIVEGVGYPNPNRSHFRSIEIWNAGLGANSIVRDGWISTAFAEGRAPQTEDASGIVLGGDMGPMVGNGRFSAMREEEIFLETLENLPGRQHAVRPEPLGSPLEQILATYDNAQITGEAISRKLEASRDRSWNFPETELGMQLRTAARLLDAGIDVPVLKVVQDGYDTHDAQPDEHAHLLKDLSEAITAFAKVMKQAGLWDQVTILTYSEFGRTARENASYGTDHGTAAPVFALGGEVQGGLSGARPSLDNLVDGDLSYTTDYRTLYHATLRDLWSIDAPEFAVSGAAPLRILG
ncbi:MAG: DUF1501 domain-containing protein [Pseudomonadota bacterium]